MSSRPSISLWMGTTSSCHHRQGAHRSSVLVLRRLACEEATLLLGLEAYVMRVTGATLEAGTLCEAYVLSGPFCSNNLATLAVAAGFCAAVLGTVGLGRGHTERKADNIWDILFFKPKIRKMVSG